MPSKILSVGNIYLQIDNMNFPIESIAMNKELVGNAYTTLAGSSALNFLWACKALKFDTAFIGKMGDDIPGKIVEELLSSEKVEFHPIISKKHQTNLSINYINKANSVMLVSGNANQSLEYVELMERLEEALKNVQYLYLGGIYKLKLILPHLQTIVNFAKTKKVIILLDHNRMTNDTTMEDRENVKKVIPLVDYYFPSREEVLDLFNTDNLEDVIRELKNMPQVTVIKDSQNGAIGIKDRKIIKIPAFEVNVMNSVGAGDSFNAGFIRGIDEGLSFYDSIEFGCASAALKISQLKNPTHEEIKKLCQTS